MPPASGLGTIFQNKVLFVLFCSGNCSKNIFINMKKNLISSDFINTEMLVECQFRSAYS